MFQVAMTMGNHRHIMVSACCVHTLRTHGVKLQLVGQWELKGLQLRTSPKGVSQLLHEVRVTWHTYLEGNVFSMCH